MRRKLLVIFFVSASFLVFYLYRAAQVQAQTQEITIPFEDRNSIPAPLTSLVWFGQVGVDSNYTDVRIAYNSEKLFISALSFDRIPRFTDTFIVNLETADNPEVGNTSYKIEGQLNDTYSIYRGEGGSWQEINASVTVEGGYRGETGPGDNLPDAGWIVAMEIPFASLGLQERPVDGTVWRASFAIQDRDEDSALTPSDTWPGRAEDLNPSSWGILRFKELPSISEFPTPDGSAIIQQDASLLVTDAMVGGGANCSDGFRDTRWTDFGSKNWNEEEQQTGQVNIQNQLDVADWLCFSKYFIEFPLSSLPNDVNISRATLKLRHFGNAGFCDPNVFPDCASQNRPFDSMIHAYTLSGEWSDGTITWNNAPSPVKNITKERVSPIWECSDPNDPSTCNTFADPPRVVEWDVTEETQEAHVNGGDFVDFALYSSDGAYHSGKYFYSSESDTPSYRPSLEIEWVDSSSTPISITPTPVPGDANGDRVVDGLDYVVWLNNYNNSTDNGASEGDFNNDSTVDGLDYVIWLNNYSA